MLSYFVDESRTGRGLATRAVDAPLPTRSESPASIGSKPALRLRTSRRNASSSHNRFTLVGTLRRHLLIRGVWTDHLLWERLADD